MIITSENILTKDTFKFLSDNDGYLFLKNIIDNKSVELVVSPNRNNNGIIINIGNISLIRSHQQKKQLIIKKQLNVTKIVSKIFSEINKWYNPPDVIDYEIFINNITFSNLFNDYSFIIDVLEDPDENIQNGLSFVLLYKWFYINKPFNIIDEYSLRNIKRFKNMDVNKILTSYKTLNNASFEKSYGYNMEYVCLFGNIMIGVPNLYFYEQKSDSKILYKLSQGEF